MTYRTEKIGDCTLYMGDCLDILPTLERVDLIIADIPFGTTQNEWDKPIPFDAMWGAIDTIRSDRTPVLLHAQPPFDKSLACSRLDLFRYEWIWEKTEATGHLNAKKMPLKAHEQVLVFYKRLPIYNPQKTFGHARKTANRVDRGEKQSTNYGSQSGVTNYDSTERYPRSVLTFSTDKQKSTLHPTQKPVSLLEYLIRTYTNPGDVVLDFTMGSGSTGIACANTRRKFVGIEINDTYFNIATRRLQEQSRPRVA